MAGYISVIGLEIHAELQTASKIYCACENAFGGEPNTRVCPVCMGMPGTLPRLNREAVALAVKAGVCMDCKIQKYSAFDRKNYCYPDLPKAYQITQQEKPICTGGYIEIKGRKIRIDNIHLEEDAGKLIHGSKRSDIDYNRCGVPLIEIVTRPDFRSAEEVRLFVEQVARRLRYAGVCDARMEQGSLRVDVNISLKRTEQQTLGVRTELKNLSSYRSISRAIAYETERQTALLERGEEVIRETRRFDEAQKITAALRSKEQEQDYRYFPEPDIPPVVLTDQVIAEIQKDIPELPHKRAARYTKEWGLTEQEADLLCADKAFSDFYDASCRVYTSYKTIAKLMLGAFSRNLNRQDDTIEMLNITPEALAAVAEMEDDGIISKNAAKEIISILFAGGGDPKVIAQENAMIIENDDEAAAALIEEVLMQNKECVLDYKNGNHKAISFLMGQLMKKAGKAMNPAVMQKLLKERLL